MGDSQGFFCSFPRIFPYYFSIFVRVLVCSQNGPKEEEVLLVGKEQRCLFFFKTAFCGFFFFPKPFVSPMQPKDGKLSFSLNKKVFSFFSFRGKMEKVVP